MNIANISRDSIYFNKTIMASGHESAHHYHELFEIYLLLFGEVNYFINDRSYPLMPGDIVLIPKGTIHRTNYRTAKHSRLLINCPEDAIPIAVKQRISERGNLYRNDSEMQRINEIFSKIEDEYTRADELSDDLIRAYILELSAVILRNDSHTLENTPKSAVGEVLEYIRNNYMNDIKLSNIARSFDMSVEHLSRIFKKETGFGLAEYLNIIRLKTAEHMLRNEPGKAVSEVAFASGFNDSNYFSYKFKEEYGISPSKIKRGLGI